MSQSLPPLARPAVRHPVAAPKRRRIWAVIAFLVALGLVIAWIDGGERALRPITEDVALPVAPRVQS